MSAYDILFEPIRIGPVTAPNRFYQVPHCTGMGWSAPRTLAAMRGIKAEGGWGVVCTEYCSIDPSTDDSPHFNATLWDEGDIKNLGAMADAVHAHGSLAGVELWAGGMRTSNLRSRVPPIASASIPVNNDPWQTKAMDAADFKALRASHRAAAVRAVRAGFDIIYVYAAHTYLLNELLNPRFNRCIGGYGERIRLVRELLEDTREAIGPHRAMALRIEVDDEDKPLQDLNGPRAELLSAIRHLPDLFDVTIVDYSQEMGSSRFVKEGSLEPYVAHVRALTGKPVVSVGRFTSPDSMVGQIKRGVLDLIGAARPSIADPFLPTKIREGRSEDIRECIGCNICYMGDSRAVPIRCTQNPTMGEEWRRGWHPERVPAIHSARPETVLVVGAGPAGLEAAHIAGKRGFRVLLAEASDALGGRVQRESRLPGLSEWIRVRDYRAQQLSKLANVEIFYESRMNAADIREAGAQHVLIATGSQWRRNGVGRSSHAALPGFAREAVMSPDDIMAGQRPKPGAAGPVIVFDDDHYYMAAVLAELLASEGHQVLYVTSGSKPAEWTVNTFEHTRTWARLHELGVAFMVNTQVTLIEAGKITVTSTLTSVAATIPFGTVVPVTSRAPDEAVWQALDADPHANAAAGLLTWDRIGDCVAPGLIAQAVYAGYRAAVELGSPPAETRRDRVVIER